MKDVLIKKLILPIIAAGMISCSSYKIEKEFYKKQIKEISEVNVRLDTKTIYKNFNRCNDTINLIGRGFIAGDYVFTVNHSVTSNKASEKINRGIIKYGIKNKISEKTYIDGVELYPVIKNDTIDLAIFDLKKSGNLKERYGNKIKLTDLVKSDKIYQGQNMFFSGSPNNYPGYYNKSTVRKLKDSTENRGPDFEDSFLVSLPLIPGSSGSSYWTNINGKNKIAGVAQFTWHGNGGIKYLDEYIKYIKNYEKKK